MSTNDFTFTDTDAESETRAADDGRDTAAQLERAAAQVELLAEENRRLRNEYARAQQARYRRTAAGLGAIGALSIAAGFLFPASREVLVALGAAGVFGGLLTYYLAPGQFVAAAVGERVYAAWAANGAAIASELGLRDDRVYLPDAQSGTAKLYAPLHATFEPPMEHDGPVVHGEDERGLVLATTGGPLFAEFRRALSGELAASAEPLARQLCDGLVEQFELAGSADPDVDPTTGRVTVAISDSAFGDVDRFDHPIGSFLATGLAVGLDRPVTLEIDVGDERADWLVTCRYETGVDDESNDSAVENERSA